MRKILRRIFAQLVTLPPTIGLRINESGCRKNSFEAPHHGHETEDGISGKRRKGSAWWWGTDRDDESNEDFSSLRWQTWELPVVRRDGWTIRAAIYQIERENPAMDPSRGFRHWKKAKRRRTRRWRWGETKDVEKPVPDRGRKVERLFVITFLFIRYRARLSTPLCRSFQFFPFPFFLFLFFLPPLHSCFPPPFSPFLSFENPCQPTGNAILQIFFSPPLFTSSLLLSKIPMVGLLLATRRTDKFSFARSFRVRLIF